MAWLKLNDLLDLMPEDRATTGVNMDSDAAFTL
jgi:hypothetical protein